MNARSPRHNTSHSGGSGADRQGDNRQIRLRAPANDNRPPLPLILRNAAIMVVLVALLSVAFWLGTG